MKAAGSLTRRIAGERWPGVSAGGGMRLLLVDDHALFREGLELVLRHLVPDIDVLHSGNIAQALTAISADPQIDLVLLDLHMPGMIGLDALEVLRKHAESPPVVVLSGSEDAQIVWRAIDAGAMGFIQKQSESKTMMAALRVVLDGGIYLPPICLTGTGRRELALAGRPDIPPRERVARLGVTRRQVEALAKMAQGKSNKVIARELGITEATVKSHLSAVFATLDVRSRTEAIYAMARLGLRPQDFEP